MYDKLAGKDAQKNLDVNVAVIKDYVAQLANIEVERLNAGPGQAAKVTALIEKARAKKAEIDAAAATRAAEKEEAAKKGVALKGEQDEGAELGDISLKEEKKEPQLAGAIEFGSQEAGKALAESFRWGVMRVKRPTENRSRTKSPRGTRSRRSN